MSSATLLCCVRCWGVWLPSLSTFLSSLALCEDASAISCDLCFSFACPGLIFALSPLLCSLGMCSPTASQVSTSGGIFPDYRTLL